MLRLLGAFFISLFYVSIANANCNALVSPQLDLRAPSRLGIGVLARTVDNQLLLGMSPYAGSLHENIVFELLETGEVAEIVWMGEVRYSRTEKSVELHEANETSGFYSRHSNSMLQCGLREVPVNNSVNFLPNCNRSHSFQGYSFVSGEKFRLASELKDVEGDVRHSIGNSLNVVASPAHLIASDSRTPEKRSSTLALFKKEGNSHLHLVNWLLNNLIEDDRMTEAEAAPVKNLIAVMLRPNSTIYDIGFVDVAEFDAIIQRASRFTVPGRSDSRVEVYRLSQ